jgi:hypothetical protein
MGLSFGGTKSSNNSTTSQSQSNTYSPGQLSIQDLLSQYLSKLFPSLASGTMTPTTQAATTAMADQINQNYSTLGDNLQKAYAARGFGKSGQAGDATLQTELARQGAQAGNLEAGASSQLQQNQQTLMDALNFAMSPIGATGSGSGTTSGSSSGFGVSAGLKTGGLNLFGTGSPWALGA